MSDENLNQKRDLADLYDDDTQKNIENLKARADELDHEYPVSGFTYKDIIMDVIFFFITTALAFGWMLLMLLIVSFVSLSYLHFNIDKMLIVSGVFAAAVAIGYIIKKVRKYKA